MLTGRKKGGGERELAETLQSLECAGRQALPVGSRAITVARALLILCVLLVSMIISHQAPEGEFDYDAKLAFLLLFRTPLDDAVSIFPYAIFSIHNRLPYPLSCSNRTKCPISPPRSHVLECCVWESILRCALLPFSPWVILRRIMSVPHARISANCKEFSKILR